jgi:hemolysin III
VSTVTGYTVERVPQETRPQLRGWLHLGAAPLATILGLLAIAIAPTVAGRGAFAVYTATTVLLFTVSAAYHRREWGDPWQGVLSRVDHSNIYLFIAGSYTPFVVLLLEPGQARGLLWIVWSVALLGVGFRVFWFTAPRWLYVSTYIALGWVAVAYLPALWRSGGPVVVTLLIAGGLLYTLGAAVYAFRRPDPSPIWFGFHEIFHALTIAAYLTQYVALVWTAVTVSP